MRIKPESFIDIFSRHVSKPEMGGAFVEKILMVGSIQHDGEFNPSDKDIFNTAVNTLLEQGVCFSPDLEVEGLNIFFNEKEDFLSKNYKADVVVLCNVFNPSSAPYQKRENHMFQVSPLHHKKGIWLQAIRESGAKAAIFFPPDPSYSEVGYDVLDGSEYQYIIEKEDEYGWGQCSLLARTDFLTP